MDSSKPVKVSPKLVIGLFFAVVLVGLIVGVFINSALTLKKNFDPCADQGGLEIIKTEEVSECPEGYPMLYDTEKTVCCLDIR